MLRIKGGDPRDLSNIDHEVSNAPIDHMRLGVIGAVLDSLLKQEEIKKEIRNIEIYLIGGVAYGILDAIGRGSQLDQNMEIKAHDIDVNIVYKKKLYINLQKLSPESFKKISTDINAGTSEELFGLRKDILSKYTISVEIPKYNKDAPGLSEGTITVKIVYGYPLIIPKLLAWRSRRDNKKNTDAETLLNYIINFSQNKYAEFNDNFSKFLEANQGTLISFINTRLKPKVDDTKIERPKDVVSLLKELEYWLIIEELRERYEHPEKISEIQDKFLRHVNFAMQSDEFHKEFKEYISQNAKQINQELNPVMPQLKNLVPEQEGDLPEMLDVAVTKTIEEFDTLRTQKRSK